jgi:hypothetical protein
MSIPSSTIDVFHAQQDLTSARSRLIQAHRDRVIASHTLLSAMRDTRNVSLPDSTSRRCRARRDTAGHYGDVVAAVATAFNAAVTAWIAASPA